MSVQNLFRLDYWFSQPFSAVGAVLWVLVGSFLLFIVLGLVAKILVQYQENKFNKMVLKRVGSLGVVMGFFGLVWMLFRQENSPYLGWRFWLLLWFVVVVVWAYRIVKYSLKRIPEIKIEEEKRASIQKYLPKKN